MTIDIRVSLPKKKFANKRWLDSIASKQRAQSLNILRKLFRQTVFGWSKKPDFGWAQTKSGDEIRLTVYPKGEGADIWMLLNEGSPAHDIFPKKQGGILRFKPGYRASTTPGSLQSQRKYRSGPYRYAKVVKHPGFQARKFTEMIAMEYADNYTKDMQDAITEVARR